MDIDKIPGKRITRKRALEICKEIREEAEKERQEVCERDAREGLQFYEKCPHCGKELE